MKVSVLIPDHNDLRIIDCINSIDEDVEVVISLNKPTRELEKLTKQICQGKYQNEHKLDIKVCSIDYPSIAGAYNNGIKNAKYNDILLMDSDCVFKEGCIKQLYNNYKGNLLSKGKVVFSSNSWITAVVARAREYHTSDKVSAYSPPLLFKKEIVKYIGGHYFHPNLCWLEDSEFDKRVQDANLKISYDLTANVIHPSLTPCTDLKSAFWYGVGKNIGVKLGIHEKPTGILGSIKKYIVEGSKAKGVASGIYLFCWKMSLLTGYLFQGLFKIRGDGV